MKVIIPAAGLSSRLRPLTDQFPKCLIPLGETCFLNETLKSLVPHRDKIDEILVITGHKEDKIQEFLADMSLDLPPVRPLFNEAFATKNNYYTVLMALEEVDDDFLLINSDVVFDPGLMGRMMEQSHSCLLVDDIQIPTDESMKLYVDEDKRVTRISKQLEIEKSLGEYIGLMRLTPEDKTAFLQALKKHDDGGHPNRYYEDVLDEILAELHISVVSTAGLSWVEVDDFNDLEKAKKILTGRP